MRPIKTYPFCFLTGVADKQDIVTGFEAGGVDYIIKPFHSAELLARIKTHVRLKKASEEIHQLRGLLPICSSCKRIRNDNGYWEQIEIYVEDHSEASFTHGICLDCANELYPGLLREKNSG